MLALYCSLMTVGVFVSVFWLYDYVILGPWAIEVLILIAVSLVQALIFRSMANEKSDLTDMTAYMMTEDEVDRNAMRLSYKYRFVTNIAIIPILLIFVIYFGAAVKITASLAIYLLSQIAVKPMVKFSLKRSQE